MWRLGQLFHSCINHLVYLHYKTQLTLAWYLLPSDISPHDEEETQEKAAAASVGFCIGVAKPIHRQHIFQGDTTKDANRSTTKKPNQPLPPGKCLLVPRQISFCHILYALEVRSQKGNEETTVSSHHPLEGQKLRSSSQRIKNQITISWDTSAAHALMMIPHFLAILGCPSFLPEPSQITGC